MKLQNRINRVILKDNQAVQYDCTIDNITVSVSINKTNVHSITENETGLTYYGYFLKVDEEGIVFLSGSDPWKL